MGRTDPDKKVKVFEPERLRRENRWGRVSRSECQTGSIALKASQNLGRGLDSADEASPANNLRSPGSPICQ